MAGNSAAVEKDRENKLRDQIAALPQSTQKEFYSRYNQQVKDPDTYAALNYLLVCGLHHFYLGKLARGLLNLAVFIIGLWALFAVGLLAGLLIWGLIYLVELPALFRSELIVQRHNNDVAENLLKQIVKT